MEILIIGSLFVALMVYASTRIKKSAAAAWEEETIAGEGFVIRKPEGFLNVIGGDENYAFEAYSKEFGGAGAEEIREATATVKIGIAADHETPFGRTEVIGENRYDIGESESEDNGITFRNSSKAAERDGKVYVLNVRALGETSPGVMRKIESMIDSFELK